MKPSPNSRRRFGLAWFCLWWAGLVLAQTACGAALSSAPPDGSEASPPPESHAAPTEAEPGQPAPTLAAPTPAPAITEERFVEIEWPEAIRVGDSDFVALALVPGEAGQVMPTAETAGHLTEGEPIEIPNLYDTHNVLAVAELSGVGFKIDRPGEVAQPLLPGEPVEWQWTIAPESAGRQVATLGLKLRFVPKAGGDTSERSVWAQRLFIEGRTVFGLSGRAADVLGVAGAVSGGVLSFPFADKFYSYLWRRLVRRKV